MTVFRDRTDMKQTSLIGLRLNALKTIHFILMFAYWELRNCMYNLTLSITRGVVAAPLKIPVALQRERK